MGAEAEGGAVVVAGAGVTGTWSALVLALGGAAGLGALALLVLLWRRCTRAAPLLFKLHPSPLLPPPRAIPAQPRIYLEPA